MLDMFSYQFMQHALLAGILASLICGIIGVYVVLKRIVFISGGIAHFSFGGIGFGYYLGINPLLTTLLFSILAAVAIGSSKKHINLQEDTSIGILWAVGMAAGVLFIGMSDGYAVNLFSYLFGNILAVSTFDLQLMAALSAFIIIAVTLLFKEFLILTFDEEYATIVGVPTQALSVFLLCLIALSIVVMIKIVGVILVIALLTIPASIGKLAARTVKSMMVVSTLCGIALTSGGLMISYYTNLASGATIVLLSAGAFLVASLITSYKHASLRTRALGGNKP